MRNAQVVQVIQTSGYSRQLLLRRIRRLMDREGAGMSTSISLCTLGSFLRPEVLPEVEVGHPLVHDAERMCFCRPPPDKGYHILV